MQPYNSRFLLGNDCLVTFVRKLDAEGVPEKEVTDRVNAWVLVVSKRDKRVVVGLHPDVEDWIAKLYATIRIYQTRSNVNV